MNKAVEAAREGNLALFQSIDGLESLLSKVDEDGRSLLHTACTSGSLELVKFIVDRSGKKSSLANTEDDEGWSPLMSAVSSGHEAIVELLLSIGADVEKTNSGGRAALHYAASKGNVPLLRMLMSRGANVNAKDHTGSTPLLRAASAGKVPAVKVLIEEGGARIEEADKLGQTALFVSAESSHNQVALYLASQGANLNVETKDGRSLESVSNSELLQSLISCKGVMQSTDMDEK
ncbi:hypothetical protein CEUSTIGMA_g7999.t1 [Chlamydomonas eustigma]|uniref:Uncharacterized protein n=1 Tax=Chlamydomonas eustigma TaxID=1157962 RepID=A0A250XCH0_9CHLO|nr:hypothetical protein CEUSTIGMA_g7999.t1 [Chlamydomonas eustigma]|eukprot:GAX80562.1 hypothetical protein CEUSTIGMA_g7999.t1 [Chlamydomonas eustigma]